MNACRCPACGANKLICLPDGTLKCEYCETVFLTNNNAIPVASVQEKFDTEVFFSNAMKYLSECETIPSDIFNSKFEKVKVQFCYSRSANKSFMPYYLLRYLYGDKAYHISAYGKNTPKSFGTSPNVLDRINKAVKKRIGNDTLGIVALMIGFVLIWFNVSFLSVMSILFFAAGITLSVLYYKKFKAEQKKELIKNNDERMDNYLKFISSINNNN